MSRFPPTDDVSHHIDYLTLLWLKNSEMSRSIRFSVHLKAEIVNSSRTAEPKHVLTANQSGRNAFSLR